MGHVLGRRRLHAMAALLAAIVTSGAVAVGPALAEEAAAPADLLVAPPGAQVQAGDAGADAYTGGSFLENYDVDVTILAEATGAIMQGGTPQILVTAVRLGSEADAAEALAAIGSPVSPEEMLADPDVAALMEAMGAEDPHVEVLPEPGVGAVARKVVVSERYSLVEFARATGRDLVVLAQLGGDGSGEVLPIMRQTLDAHLAAFPDVTLPAGARSGPSWVLVGGVAAAVLAVLGLFVARAGRGRRTTVPVRPSTAPVPQVHGDGPSRARANW